MGGERLLLHTCCGPCTIHPLEVLRAEGWEVHGYFFNPNVHPYTEYRRRAETLAAYAAGVGLPLTLAPDYPVEEFLRQVVFREDERCRFCYGLRLRRAARMAREGQFHAFTTTLLVSPYQKHDLVREEGLRAASEEGVEFLYRDFRGGFREAQARARALGMYRQPYCGCLYSERERYCKKAKGHHVLRGDVKGSDVGKSGTHAPFDGVLPAGHGRTAPDRR